MHSRIRRAIGTGFHEGEWRLLSLDHPVSRLYQTGKTAEGDRLLRDMTAAHEAGHAVMGRLVGVDVERIVIGHLHEVDGRGSTAPWASPSTGSRAGRARTR